MCSAKLRNNLNMGLIEACCFVLNVLLIQMISFPADLKRAGQYVPMWKNFFTNMGEFYLFTFELRCKHHDYKFLSLNSYTHLGL